MLRSFWAHLRHLDVRVVGESSQVSMGGEDVSDPQLGENFLQVIGALNGELGKVKLELSGKRRGPCLGSSRGPGPRLISLPLPLSFIMILQPLA